MTISLKAIERERKLKLFFFLGAQLCLFLAITQIKNVLVSFLLAFVIYYMLAPAVDFLERRGLSRVWATTLPFLILTLMMTVVIRIFFPVLGDQIESLKVNFPKYLESTTTFLNSMESRASHFISEIYPYDLKGTMGPQAMEMAQAALKNLPNYLSQSLAISLLSPFLAFFMLLDGRDFVRKIMSLVPNHFFELVLNLNWQINRQLGGFIRARLIQSLLVGFTIWIGLLILDFPYSLFLAIFAGILNVIPYLGPFIGIVPALIISFSNGGSGDGNFIWLLLIYSSAQILDIVLITPFIVAKIVDLHPVTVVIVIIAGAQMMGILGMIISIPLFCTLKVSTQSIYKHLTDFRA